MQASLRAAADHRLFPAFWLISTTGLRRSELLGLRWDDIDLDRTTIDVLTASQAWQTTEQEAVGIEPAGWVFTDAAGSRHPLTCIETLYCTNQVPARIVNPSPAADATACLTPPRTPKDPGDQVSTNARQLRTNQWADKVWTMDAEQVIASIDPVSMNDVASLGSVHGPCVSLFLSTHRFGPETTTQDPLRLRNLVKAAKSELVDAGTERQVIDEILTPVSSLVDDTTFWQHQSDGLAVFSGPGRFESFRIPLALAEEVTVAGSFRVRPLLASVSGDDRCFVLAVSQNSVQLFESTRYTMTRLDAGSIPESMDAALAFEDPERHLQSHSVGGGDVAFHGHGMGGEVEHDAIERFLRAVDRGVIDALGDARDPLVLACIESYLPIYRSVTRYPNVAADVIAGTAERRSVAELHRAAWQIVQKQIAATTAAAIARYQSAVGTGNTADTILEVLAAARDGRVAQLFVADGAPMWGRIDEQGNVSVAQARSISDEDLVDRAVFETLAHNGEVIVTDPDALGVNTVVAAVLRY